MKKITVWVKMRCGRLDPQKRSKRKEEEDDEDEKGRRAKKNTAVYKPTSEEMEQRLTTHCPCKPWCKHCVRGRATNTQHKKSKGGDDEAEEEMKVARVAFDYFFMSKADEDTKTNPILAMVDEKTGERYARAAGKKGVGTNGELYWLIQDMVEELKSWGHAGGVSGHLILKCDNEPAIKALRDVLGKLIGGANHT